MTRLRALTLSGIAAGLLVAGAASKSFAVEPGDFTNYLRGATQGLPLGALPPPGIYGGFGLNATGLGSSPGKGNQATSNAENVAWGYGLNVLFVPGWNFLGATYGAAIVQGFYSGSGESSINPPFATSSLSGPEIANTTFTPIDLSWNLGHGWFTSLALTVVGPDGSQWASTAGDLDLNPDFWTIAPGFAISYLDANWLASANFRYDIQVSPSRGVTMGTLFGPPGYANGFVSGNELFGDLTVLYKVGKWSFGPVGYFEAQTTADKPGGGVPCTPGICGYQSQVAIGGLVWYDFGPVSVQAWFDDTVECANAICGIDVWGRMSFRIWAPESPKPLVAKN
jgi:hypothetical protein